MAGTYHDLVGTWGYASGTNGTVTIPAGAQVLQIIVHATSSGTMTIFGGSSIPVIAGALPVSFRFIHTLVAAGNNAVNSGSQNIVLSGTDSYFIEYVKAGNT
jgi:hypothetical protein